MTRDPDGDNLTNLQEVNGVNGYDPTSPTNPDSDGDSLNDDEEVFGLANVFTDDVAGSLPGDSTDPNLADTDEDGLSDGEEVSGSLNPFLMGVVDAGFPNGNGDPTNPNLIDTDDDELTDKEELDNRLDANDDSLENSLNGDPDMDDMTNIEEIENGTDPRDADSDDDQLNDGDEDEEDTDPLNPDTDGDSISDGDEIQGEFNDVSHGFGATDPLKADSDGDNRSDTQELTASPPTDPNSDLSFTAPTPAAYYAFDGGFGIETAVDWVFRNDGIASAPTPDSRIAGKFGMAVNITGTASNGQWFELPRLEGVDGGVALTISAWFNENSGTKSYSGLVMTREETVSNWGLALRQINGADAVESRAANGPATFVTPLNEGEWNHLAMVYNPLDGSSNRLYLNGVEVASAAQTGPLFNGLGWMIGTDASDINNRDIRSAIDDVAFFSAALTPAEIAAIYNNGDGASIASLYNLTAPVPPSTDPLEITGISYDAAADEVGLTWNSNGFAATFTVRASATLDTAISTWATVATGVTNGGATTSTTITGQSDPKMFYAVEEEVAAP